MSHESNTREVTIRLSLGMPKCILERRKKRAFIPLSRLAAVAEALEKKGMSFESEGWPGVCSATIRMALPAVAEVHFCGMALCRREDGTIGIGLKLASDDWCPTEPGSVIPEIAAELNIP